MASEACAVYRKNSDWFELGKSFYGGTTKNATIEGGGKFLRALDLQSGKLVWEVPKIGGGVTASGLMSTAGGLVFYGDNTAERWLPWTRRPDSASGSSRRSRPGNRAR